MPHYFEKGFSVRDASWHGLATVLEEYPGREKAMEIAGHDWNIIEAPVKIQFPDKTGKLKWVESDRYKGIIRDDTNELICVHPMSYPVVPNSVMWDVVDSIVGQGNVKYETAGILKKGAVLWVLARIDEPEQVKGDNSPIFPYCLVATTHDATGGLRASCVNVRVICWNTYTAAINESRRTGREYYFRHTKNVLDHIEEAKEALGLVKENFRAFMELSRELAKHKLNDDSIKDFLTSFIPDPPKNLRTDRSQKNVDEAREKVIELLNGKTVPDAHKRTSYGIFCAGTEYIDYLRDYRSEESLFRRTIYDVDNLKPKLAKLCMKVAVN